MAGTGEKTELTPRQRAALLALLEHRSIAGAAAACGVPDRTLYRWCRSDATFRAALATAEAEAIGAAARGLATLTEQAIEALGRGLATVQPIGAQLRAADLVLSHTVRLRELATIESRLSALEDRLGISEAVQ